MIRSQIRQWMTRATLMTGALLSIAPAFSQEAPKPAGPIITHESWWDTIVEGGWVMWPIGAFSVATIWLIVDLWMRISPKRLAPAAQVAAVRDLFRMGDYVGAYQYCKNASSAFADTVKATLSYIGDGQLAAEEAMMGAISTASSELQTRINYLSVIGVCTPMVGLLGTVAGMKGAFRALKDTGAGNAGELAGKIGEVLIATASGLAIAIPAFMFFYFLRNKLQGAVHEMQEIIFGLFRKMPYDHLKDCHVGEEEFYAATPNWVASEEATPVAAA
jgi:biopolymer transport protein ExbB